MTILPLILGLAGMSGTVALANRWRAGTKKLRERGQTVDALPKKPSTFAPPAPAAPAPSPQQVQQEAAQQKAQQAAADKPLRWKLAQWIDDNLTPEQNQQAAQLAAQLAARLGKDVSDLTVVDMCPLLLEYLSGEMLDKLEADIPEIKEVLDECAPAAGSPEGPSALQASPYHEGPGHGMSLTPEAAEKLRLAEEANAKLAKEQARHGVAPGVAPAKPPGTVAPASPYVAPVPAEQQPVAKPGQTPGESYKQQLAEMHQWGKRVQTEDLIDVLNRQRGRNWTELKYDAGPALNEQIPRAYKAAVLALGMRPAAVSGAVATPAPNGYSARIEALPLPPDITFAQEPQATEWFVEPRTFEALQGNAAQPAPEPPVSEPAEPTARQQMRTGALALQTFLRANPVPASFGSKGQPSEPVKSFQRLANAAGHDLVVDGILGKNTRKAAAAVDVTFPERAIAKQPEPVKPPPPEPVPAGAPDEVQARQLAPGVASNITDNKFQYDRALLRRFQSAAGLVVDGLYGGGSAGALKYYLGGQEPPKPLFSPTAIKTYLPPQRVPVAVTKPGAAAPQPAPVTVTPKQGAQPAPPAAEPQSAAPTAYEAAVELREYLLANPRAGAFGYRNHPSEPVRRFQKAAGIVEDGILGKGVRAAGKKVGVTFPDRPATSSGLNVRSLARDVTRNVRGQGRGYDAALVSRFQAQAGLPVTGRYDAQTAGALRAYGSRRAPVPFG